MTSAATPESPANPLSAPVIAIDGPMASGKGTVAQLVAAGLGWHYLDSGALYRLTALAATESNLLPPATSPIDDTAGEAIARVARNLPIAFTGSRIRLDGRDVTDAIRTEAISQGASRVAALPPVRAALLQRQRDFGVAPGLVADGRDMGSVVFPNAPLKVFLTASAQTRAERRYNQLIQNGISAKIEDVLKELQDRDLRDSTRPVAPLKHYPDARLLETDSLTAEQAAKQIQNWFQALST
jgi:cytidylate kinase